MNLNIDDVLFNERECIVLGKGDSERIVYFDAKTKIHLQKYLESRDDNNPALFVSSINLTSDLESLELKKEYANSVVNQILKKCIPTSLEEQWQPRQSIKECRSNRFKNY